MTVSAAGIRNARERQTFLYLLAEVSEEVERDLAREAGVRGSAALPSRRYRWLLESLGGVVLAFNVACVTLLLTFLLFSWALHLSF